MSVNGSPSEGVWEVVREEVEYDEPACYPGSSPYSSPYVRTTTVQSPHVVQPVVNTTVTRYVSPVCSSHTDGVPSNMCNNSVITCSPTRRHHSSVVHGSPGRVVSRRVVRYASPVRSRVTTTTTYRCSPASPWPESDACVNAAAADLLPSYEAPRGGLYTPKKGNVARPGVDWERLAAESRGDTGRSGSSYPISCKKATMLEAEESAPEPAPGLPQTARAKSKASPSPGRMTRQPLRVYYEESDEEGVECIEMEPDPSKPAGQCLRSSGSLAFSDSEDDYAGRPPQKKRMSMMYHVSTAKVEDCGLLLGGHEYMTLGVLSSSAASPSRPYLSPCYRERSRELKEKEAELEQFLQMSAKRRGRLIDSIRKRRRNSDGEEEENADGIQLPKVEAGGRWGGSSGNQQAMFSRKPWAPSPRREVSEAQPSSPRMWKKGTYPPIPATSEEQQITKETLRADEPDPIASHGCFVSEGRKAPERRSSWHGENRTVFGDVSPLPLHGSYHRTVMSGVRRLFGEGAPHAPIDDEQWKELAMKLRQQAESHTISVDRS
ncbi:hypothetical protein FOZ62_006032 [Perkinsus olseni]|uniref:Uncharacterized protein n=1 Tax=Perkinsus olseni TaxID=32597 RepID=A0A7J6U3T5_PEROL|nr:hypothetical protein FOZ62_006032 [Perkinsus olseni]